MPFPRSPLPVRHAGRLLAIGAWLTAASGCGDRGRTSQEAPAPAPELAPADRVLREFWFHPHVRSSEQVERGLYGVLIVEDRDPTPYSRDIVWVIDDFCWTTPARSSPSSTPA